VEFSKMRPVFKSPRLWSLNQFYPPYSGKHRRLLNFLIKYKP
jgi:hypothetical protein